MKRLLVALWLGATILAVATASQTQQEELSALQQKALDLSLDTYHGSDQVINAFKVHSMQEATETDFSAGTFVRLQFQLKQTGCRKHHRTRPGCRALRHGREINCYVCYKFVSIDEMVLPPFVDCLPVHLLRKEREETRANSCKEVEQKDETGLGFPGVFSFSRTDY